MLKDRANKRIVYFVSDSLSLNTFGYFQISSLVERGFKVYTISNKGKLNSEVLDICEKNYELKFLTRSIAPMKDLLTLINLILILRSIKPFLIIYSTPKSSLIGSIAGGLCKVEFRVFQIWGARWQTLNWFPKILVKCADKLTIFCSTHTTAVSRSILNLYQKEFNIDSIILLGNGSTIGVSPSIFFPNKIKDISHNDFVLGYAGRIAREKGISDLIKIWKVISPYHSDVKLELIGSLDLQDPISLDEIGYLESHPSILWKKHLPKIELAEHMRLWNLQIFLSKREGLGNVVIEAGACGIPTICWDIDGVRDAVPPDMMRFLVPYKNYDRVISMIEKCIAEPLSTSDKDMLVNWTINNFEETKVLRLFTDFIELIHGK